MPGTASDARSDAEQLRGAIGALEAALAVAEGRIQTGEAALAAAETRLRVETVARATLRTRSTASGPPAPRPETCARRWRPSARPAAPPRRRSPAARAEAERTGTTLQERIAELERRAAAAPELERVAREHASEREPAADAGRLVADLDAAADALRRRGTPGEDAAAARRPSPSDESEPPAPDAEPADRVGRAGRRPQREPCVPAVEPARPKADPTSRRRGCRRASRRPGPAEAGEPPAPDAEPAVESAAAAGRSRRPRNNRRRRLNRRRRPPRRRPRSPSSRSSPPPVVPAARGLGRAARGQAVPGRSSCPRPGRPSRALATGSERRDYPLLRGAIVKLAHDDPATAAALLVALLPAQGAAIEGPLGYDLTIREAGTFAVGIAGGRASVEQIDDPAPARRSPSST